MNVGSILSKVAAQHPERAALVYGEVRRTFREFNERTNRLASRFIRMGLAKGNRVAILQRNCPELLECLFVSFKAGGIAVHINARLHPREYQYIIDHSGAKI